MSEIKPELLITKTHQPQLPLDWVARPRLSSKLVEALRYKLVLLSAPAGYGKTTVVIEALRDFKKPVGWVSLEASDNTPGIFWNYFIIALQSVIPGACQTALNALQSPQPPPAEWLLTAIINSISDYEDDFVLVLDDYHTIESPAIHEAMNFFVEHLPHQIHLVIASRIDPPLPLARWRVRGQLNDLRATDLRFTPVEAAEFLNQAMGLNLSAEDIASLENRTEGWIAGLQLAAISLQGHQDAASFIKSFTGSHHFVLDYLLEEVLQKQSETVRDFLLRTSILDRLCGPLCDAVLLNPSASGQETLEYLEHANLFIVPLDDRRHWYRYHHLFADLLRQRLLQNKASSAEEEGREVAELHSRASQWYEDHGLEIEAFQHAAAANDIERAERLIEGDGIPLHFQGAVATIMDWLALLPKTIMVSRPSLCVKYATLSLVAGQTTGLEEKLQMAEAAIQGIPSAAKGLDDKTRNLIGQIASARARLAVSKYQIETIFVQAHRALEYLPPDNLVSRFRASWSLAYAYHFRGERAAAAQACAEALSIAEASGNILDAIIATLLMGQIQQLENQLRPAFETFQRCLRLLGDNYPPPSTGEGYRGLATIYYEWNNLDAAEHYGQRSLQLLRQYDRIIDRFIISEVFLARLKIAQGDIAGAASMLLQTEQTARQNNFTLRLPEIAAAQVQVLLKQTNLPAAAELARRFEIPLSQARVLLAQGDSSAALAVLGSLRQQMEAKGWADERLKTMILQSVALSAHGEKDQAVRVLGEALVLAKPGDFIRVFVDEGAPMSQLLSKAAADGIMPDYAGKLLAVFKTEDQKSEDKPYQPTAIPLSEPLSQRELEILRLIAQGLSNREICERLFLALDTVKGHNSRIYGKLQVQRRTEAIARARELGLL